MKRNDSVEKELEIVVYEPHLPPARHPSKGSPNLLSFRDDEARQEQLKKCEIRVAERCMEGARMGCALKASKKCGVPWVLKLMGLQEKVWQERDQCETEFIKECMYRTKIQCGAHASEFCSVAFKE